MKTLALIAALGLVAAPAFANEAAVKTDAKADKVVAGQAHATVKADAKAAKAEAKEAKKEAKEAAKEAKEAAPAAGASADATAETK